LLDESFAEGGQCNRPIFHLLLMKDTTITAHSATEISGNVLNSDRAPFPPSTRVDFTHLRCLRRRPIDRRLASRLILGDKKRVALGCQPARRMPSCPTISAECHYILRDSIGT
jgi:hypothetical protein